MRSPSSSAGSLTLTLSEVTLADIPAITEVWYNSLYAPEFASIWPDTPTCRRWWDDTNRYDLEYKPFQKYVKVTTPAVVDGQATGEEKIVAYAKWDLAMPDVRGPRFAPWGSQTNVDDADAFFGTLERERKRVCGHAPNYYLDMLGTHSDYQRRGAGAMLVKWGCDLADREGMVCYVDATDKGKGLYTKFGFEDKTIPGQGAKGVSSMVRYPKQHRE